MAGDCAWRVWQRLSRRSGGVVLMLRGFGQITNSRTRGTRKIQEKLFRLLLSRPWRILGVLRVRLFVLSPAAHEEFLPSALVQQALAAI
jgi:hypothetical protein